MATAQKQNTRSSGAICSVHGCHYSQRTLNSLLAQPCFDHKPLTRKECSCQPPYRLHRMPPNDADLQRQWLAALNRKSPPKNVFVCSFHFVDREPTQDNPVPELYLGYKKTTFKKRRVLVRTTASANINAIELSILGNRKRKSSTTADASPTKQLCLGGSLCTPRVPGWPAVILGLCIWVALVAQPGETATTATPATVCEVRMTSSGTFRSPGFPDSYPAQADCRFLFDYGDLYNTTLIFTTFNMPNGEGGSCGGNDFVQVYLNQGTFQYCGAYVPPVLTGIKELRLVTSQALGSGFGFEAVYMKQLQGCGETNLTSNRGAIQPPRDYGDHIEGSCIWAITVEEGSTVILVPGVYFNGDGLGRDTCDRQFFKVYDGPSRSENNVVATLCGQSPQHRLIESSGSSLLVEFYTNGTSMNVYGDIQYFASDGLNGCENVVLNGSDGRISIHDTNTTYSYDQYVWLRNGACRWTVTVEEGFVIQLAFESFQIDLCSSVGMCNYWHAQNCQNNFLTIYDGSVEKENAVMAKLCSDDRPWLMTSKTNSVILVLVVGQEGDFTKNSLSVQYKAVNSSLVNRDCGERTVTGSGGEITSPNFPDMYDNLLDCEWVITVDEGFNVQLIFSNLNLEGSYNCMFDSVQVRSGNNITAPKFLSPFCYNFYYQVNAPAREVFIKFVTNGEGRGSSLRISWSRVCRRDISSDKLSEGGTLRSPLYPQHYGNDLHCEYNLYMPPGGRLILSFTNLHLEAAGPDGLCVNDYVEIIESQLPYGSAYSEGKRFCGDSIPEAVTTYGNTKVNFVTNGDTTASGYELVYTFVNHTGETTTATSASG